MIAEGPNGSDEVAGTETILGCCLREEEREEEGERDFIGGELWSVEKSKNEMEILWIGLRIS